MPKVGGSSPSIRTLFIYLNFYIMEMYKQAARLGLRVPTTKGLLSVEQLWTLKLKDLSDSLKLLKKNSTKTSDSELDFLEEVTTVDVVSELAFGIMKDIYLTKREEAKQIKEDAEVKAYNQKIIEIIARKQDQDLENKSLEELQALLKK